MNRKKIAKKAKEIRDAANDIEDEVDDKDVTARGDPVVSFNE